MKHNLWYVYTAYSYSVYLCLHPHMSSSFHWTSLYRWHLPPLSGDGRALLHLLFSQRLGMAPVVSILCSLTFATVKKPWLPDVFARFIFVLHCCFYIHMYIYICANMFIFYTYMYIYMQFTIHPHSHVCQTMKFNKHAYM
jgi:hypothetical protein